VPDAASRATETSARAGAPWPAGRRTSQSPPRRRRVNPVVMTGLLSLVDADRHELLAPGAVVAEYPPLALDPGVGGEGVQADAHEQAGRQTHPPEQAPAAQRPLLALGVERVPARGPAHGPIDPVEDGLRVRRRPDHPRRPAPPQPDGPRPPERRERQPGQG